MPARRARNAGGELAEAAFQRQVEQLAAFYGWRTYHTHDSRRSAAGFPDLVLVRGPELLFAELKTASGRVRPEQEAWIDALGYVAGEVNAVVDDLDRRLEDPLAPEQRPAVEVYIWRPADFDALHARLARGRHRQAVDWAR